MNFENVRKLISDEDLCWERANELRSINIPKLLKDVRVERDVVGRAISVIHAILTTLNLREHLLRMDPGHGLGHITRDYCHALRLRNLQIEPSELFIGLIAGVLHDVGCAMVNRYDDVRRAVRHAEVGALLLSEVFRQDSFGLNCSEQLLIQYAVAAHTNYLKPIEVIQSNGVKRQINPYIDMFGDRPIMAVWLPRWIDRLDCNGPCFVARHYLTLIEDHHDFTNEGFRMITYASELRPLLRTMDEIRKHHDKPTMLEHLRGYADSQTNDSVYGKYDFGVMQILRDQYRSQLRKIVQEVAVSAFSEVATVSTQFTQEYWKIFLSGNIEPTEVGLKAAEVLHSRFSSLPYDSQVAWSSGFYATMREYDLWAKGMLKELSSMEKGWMELPSIVSDVRDVIVPLPEWLKILS